MNKKFSNILILTGVIVLIGAVFALSSYYQGMFISEGYDPTMGNEIRFNSGTYDVPVIPASAISSTIAFDVLTPFTVQISTIPAGAIVTHVDVVISEAFDAGTTNVFLVGTSTDPDHYVDAGDIDETLVSTASIADKGEQVTADTDVYITYTQTGGAATAGAARATVWYIIPSS